MGVFDYNKEIIRDCCEIEKCPSGSILLSIKANPIDITLRTNIECNIINSLGCEYFWNENDNRLKPKFEYNLVNLIPEVMYDPSE